MNNSEFCHPGYIGDSICGYKTHFGNQVTAANLPLLGDSTIKLTINDTEYDTGRRKLGKYIVLLIVYINIKISYLINKGVILGDFSQIGCNSVTDPGTTYIIHYPC